jgi:hypothetical protein
MRASHLMIALLSLVAVLAVVWWEWRHRTSPGPLHPSHASVPKLLGASGCDACHGQSRNTMATACSNCHRDIASQIDGKRGLHGFIDRRKVDACGPCHVDHNGARVRLVNERSFRDAGFIDPDKFDHRRVTKYELSGRHAELKCDQCHITAHLESLPEGRKRYLGLIQECTSCHKDVHEGTFGPSCDSCHGQSGAFKKAPLFTHTKDFELTGGHANLTCQKCHQKTGETSVKMLLVKRQPVRACASCHDDPHKGAFGNDCRSCHDTVKPFKPASDFKHTKDFPLTGAHAGPACADCHKAGVRSVAELMVNKVSPRQCADCHVSPHSATLIATIRAAPTPPHIDVCTECHRADDRSFLIPVATMTPTQHRATGFLLDPPHDKPQCVECHKEIGKRKPLERGPTLAARFAALYPGRSMQACEKCHVDPHAGQFKASANHSACVSCHELTRFVPSRFDIAEHDKTRLTLTKSHRAVACTSCHATVQRVVKYIGTPLECSACHKDVHNGIFDQHPRPSVVDGKLDCARCHDTGSFSTVAWSAADHERWTGYVLVGAHAKASCVACHKPTKESSALGRRLGVAPRECSSCHADPHAGQFARQMVTDCARCHSNSGKFTETTFLHDRDSRFKLDNDHAKLQCDACHRPTEVAPRVSVIRYRPLGMQCQDCHAPGELPGRGPP